ncbi:MAG: methyltransferase domain-containing protein [Oscillospiraceae bacterium]|nr:methyltransferase domain-containing protein [Oscillospiraceae bacterium]
MKKCPRCLKYDSDNIRFCRHCNTELFFLNRFENSSSAVYNTLSTVYDLLDIIYFRRSEKSPRTALVSAITDAPVKVLDVCAGTCTNSILIAQNKPNAKITALDKAEKMLKIAQKKFRKKGIQNIEITVADACNSGLPDGTFDVILLSLVLHEISEDLQSAFLREAKRLLAPNGEIIVIEWERPASFSERLKFALIELIEPKIFKEFLKKDLRRFFENAGFTVLDKQSCDYTVVFRMR